MFIFIYLLVIKEKIIGNKRNGYRRSQVKNSCPMKCILLNAKIKYFQFYKIFAVK